MLHVQCGFELLFQANGVGSLSTGKSWNGDISLGFFHGTCSIVIKTTLNCLSVPLFFSKEWIELIFLRLFLFVVMFSLSNDLLTFVYIKDVISNLKTPVSFP